MRTSTKTRLVMGACGGLSAGTLSLLVACAGGGGGGSMPDAGSDGAPDTGADVVSPDGGDGGGGGGCAGLAAAQCSFLAQCTPGTFKQRYASMADCEADVSASCSTNLSAPRSGVTSGWVGACTASYASQASSCAGGPVPLPVPAPGDPCAVVGAGSAGDTCGVDAQCASDSCDRPGTLCGTCAATAKMGDPCGNPGVACERGTACSTHAPRTCVAIVGVGASCDFGVTSQCVGGADCVTGDAGATSGTCQASGAKAGVACNPKGIGAPRCWQEAGFFCDGATMQCAPIDYQPAGSSCGVAEGGAADEQCAASVCEKGTCTAPGAEGSACTAAGCASGSTCVDGDAGAGVCTAVDPTCKNVDAGSQAFAFAPSNVKLSDIMAQAAKAQVEDVSSACGIATDPTSPITDCFASPIVTVKQPDGTSVNLVVVKSLSIEPTGSIGVTGSLPIVIVSMGDITVHGGSISGNSADLQLGPGAFPGGNPDTKGPGPGGGPGDSTSAYIGAGGGSFCGIGGMGGGGSMAGATYGTADDRPLLGGSGGGGGAVGGGSGGGAIQIVAAGNLTFDSGSTVTVGGQGGWFGGGAMYQNAGGAGSGGSILLEATNVTVAGTLAANGGGGGGDDAFNAGSDATPDATPAPVGKGGAGTAAGGAGSAGASINGSPGLAKAGKNSGGGGGGAGRIRINSMSGAATLTGGTLSPDATTACATQGTVRKITDGP